MADENPLAGLLDRAGKVFSLAGTLGRAFHEEGPSRAILYDPTKWQRHAPTFNEFYAALLDLREAMRNPPDGFGPVAQQLLQAAKLAKGIRDSQAREDGFAAFLDFSPDLNTLFQAGWEAVKQVTKARRLDDPFAFVDELAVSNPAGIDTTPATPKPPNEFIEAASRDLPSIMANVLPRHDGEIELVASHLGKRLQDAGHSLAAAQWAVHEAIRAGRLRAGRIELVLPASIGLNGEIQAPFGHKGFIGIPKGKPAPFDAFQVAATDSLWAWWRSVVAGTAQPSETQRTADCIRDNLIEQLYSGPDDAELSRRELALLEAYLKQPGNRPRLSDMQLQARGQPLSQRATQLAKLRLVRDYNRNLRATTPTATEAELVLDAGQCEPAEAADDTLPSTKAKRSTERGEGRAKLIAALTKHHKYADGGCLNMEPIGNNELARLAVVSDSTASAFFNKEFNNGERGGHAKYRAICSDAMRLIAALKLLNQEFSPHHLFGAKSDNEIECEDE